LFSNQEPLCGTDGGQTGQQWNLGAVNSELDTLTTEPPRHRHWSVAWRSGDALCRINEVTLRRARMCDCLQAGKPSRYEASQLGRLSLLPSVGW